MLIFFGTSGDIAYLRSLADAVRLFRFEGGTDDFGTLFDSDYHVTRTVASSSSWPTLPAPGTTSTALHRARDRPGTA